MSVEELREARLRAARRNSRWTEIEEVDPVPRHRHWLVSATTDEILERYRGIVFRTGSCSAISDVSSLYWYVEHESGELVFLERVGSPATWTEHLERRERRKHRV